MITRCQSGYFISILIVDQAYRTPITSPQTKLNEKLTHGPNQNLYMHVIYFNKEYQYILYGRIYSDN